MSLFNKVLLAILIMIVFSLSIFLAFHFKNDKIKDISNRFNKNKELICRISNYPNILIKKSDGWILKKEYFINRKEKIACSIFQILN